MSYIILNGTDSRSINGLLIQSLPSIVKPMQRTMVETIDGRDGDIVTVLGYSAYDRDVKIGLHGQFDINEVISFFDSEGTAVFSDEPDHYFRYAIYKQIDFERLIRFREAEVTFHVQPFKYPLAEVPVTTLETVTDGKQMLITNRGNQVSKPTITITGTGNIGVSLNGSLVLQIALGDEGSITIDVESLEASKDGVLKNRLCTGDYKNLSLPVGRNTLLFTGTVTAVSVTNYSRWL